jgi:hypothetical protein
MRLTGIAKCFGFIVFIAALIFTATWLLNKAGVGQGKIPANMAAEEKFPKVELKPLAPDEEVSPNILYRQTLNIQNEGRQRDNELANASNRQARAINHQRGSQKVDFWVLLLVVLGVVWYLRQNQTKLLEKIADVELALRLAVGSKAEQQQVAGLARATRGLAYAVSAVVGELNKALVDLRPPQPEELVSPAELVFREKLAALQCAVNSIDSAFAQFAENEGVDRNTRPSSGRRVARTGHRPAVPTTSARMVDDLVAQELPVDDTSKTNLPRPTAPKSV